MICKVKLSKRYARRLLNEGHCKVHLSTAFGEYTTGNGIKTSPNTQEELVYIVELAKHVPITEIKEIYHQATRFSPLMVYEEVDWE